jgi:monoamine oxidase
LNGEADIVIVGAGAAGVGAARALADQNLGVIWLEASSRIGGRAWTQETRGLDLDLGCGWLHSADRNAWARIARDSGVALNEARAAWGKQFHNLGFTEAEQAAAWQAFEGWTQRVGKSPPPSDCAADALDAGGEWNSHIRAIASFISGAPLEKLSAADYAAYDEASSENNWRVRTGLGALVARSAPALPLHLASPVRAIRLQPGGVSLDTDTGTLRARAAILTVSSAVLAGDTIKLPGELEPWREAARQLPLGLNEKLFLRIVGDSPFEAETHVTGNPRDPLTASYYIRPFGWPVIECFFGGDRARLLEEEGQAAGFAFAIQQLVHLFGEEVRTRLRPCAASGWSQMKTIGGAYSYALPGHASARQELARPFDRRLFFAGEATNATDYSTAHGAHDTGVRAAREALAALGR